MFLIYFRQNRVRFNPASMENTTIDMLSTSSTRMTFYSTDSNMYMGEYRDG